MSTSPPVIVWFRSDLRLSDNPALTAAVATGAPIIPLYILDTHSFGAWSRGAASRVWLHHSLQRLAQTLSAIGLRLYVASGAPQAILEQICRTTHAQAIYWNRVYEPAAIARDTAIKKSLTEQSLSVHSSKGNVLFEPFDFANNAGKPFQVFTPFFKACMARLAHETPLPAPKSAHGYAGNIANLSTVLDDLHLLPNLGWDAPMMTHWQVGEQAAAARLDDFCAGSLTAYKDQRDRPDKVATSRLSPHLHFGEISVRQIFAACPPDTDAALKFLSEVGWREFSYHLLYHFPTLPEQPLQTKFAAFPWRADPAALAAWQQGRTGYPMVDAGMRELWQTGWMHNRVRMIVASFLVKHLLIPWQVGARWFWDTLVDADLASNSASWQWVAGCGADAAPYFRVFNPNLQAEKFDPNKTYARKFLPELGTPAYPKPIVDLTLGRERALAALASIKG